MKKLGVFVLILMLFVLQLAACGNSPTTNSSSSATEPSLTSEQAVPSRVVEPTVVNVAPEGDETEGSLNEQIIGLWSAASGSSFEFFSNGTLIETEPDGSRYASTYTLNEDNKTLTVISNGFPSQSSIIFSESGALEMYGGAYERINSTSESQRTIAELVVGSWNGEGGIYDFYADGTWAYYSGSELIKGGTYTISADSKTIIKQSAQYGSEDEPLTIVNSTTLVLRPPFVFDRTADIPAKPFPASISLP